MSVQNSIFNKVLLALFMVVAVGYLLIRIDPHLGSREEILMKVDSEPAAELNVQSLSVGSSLETESSTAPVSQMKELDHRLEQFIAEETEKVAFINEKTAELESLKKAIDLSSVNLTAESEDLEFAKLSHEILKIDQKALEGYDGVKRKEKLQDIASATGMTSEGVEKLFSAQDVLDISKEPK